MKRFQLQMSHRDTASRSSLSVWIFWSSETSCSCPVGSKWGHGLLGIATQPQISSNTGADSRNQKDIESFLLNCSTPVPQSFLFLLVFWGMTESCARLGFINKLTWQIIGCTAKRRFSPSCSFWSRVVVTALRSCESAKRFWTPSQNWKTPWNSCLHCRSYVQIFCAYFSHLRPKMHLSHVGGSDPDKFCQSLRLWSPWFWDKAASGSKAVFAHKERQWAERPAKNEQL